jgi:F0F1-type ATP synthase membrane subunit b/b'
MIAVHLLVVQANNRVPPQLDNALPYTLIAFLIFTILLWQFILWRRFQDPR